MLYSLLLGYLWDIISVLFSHLKEMVITMKEKWMMFSPFLDSFPFLKKERKVSI
jgi:hypothetical protein